MKKTTHGLIKLIPPGLKRAVPERMKQKIKSWISYSTPPADVNAENEDQHQKGESRPNQNSLSGNKEAVESIRFFLEEEYLNREEYNRKWQEHFSHRQENYFAMHKHRYYELLNTFSYYYPSLGDRPLVLEIGVSEFLLLYKYFFPEIRLVTIDRPKELFGFDAEYCIGRGDAERHYYIDLNQQLLSRDYGKPPLGRFDYVICTEVLEHLIVNPVEFLGSLINLLTPRGFLYLTTPNFFRHDNMEKIARGINPQDVYPPMGKNIDAHHHFREYDMKELLQFVGEAGGKVVAHYFSGCWDDKALQDGILKEHPERKSNMVLVVKGKDS